MEKIHNKLVRDKIPEIIRANGDTAEVKILNLEEKIQYLHNKLDEEVGELYVANTKDEQIGELADILEILYSIADENNINWTEVESFCKKKRGERGGFSKGVFLVSTEEK